MVFREGSGLVDSVFGISQAPIRAFLETRGEAYEQESRLKLLFDMATDDHAMIQETSMTSMSGPQPVGESGAYPEDNMQEGYKRLYEHMTWKDQFVLSREIIEDAKAMDLKKRPEAFVKAHYRTREMFGAGLITGGLSGATFNFRGKAFNCAAGDKLSMFNTAHTSITGGATQSNLFSNTLTADNLGLAETAMQNFKDDNGNVLDVAPHILLIPNTAAMKKAAFAAVGSDQIPGSNNNDFNYQVGRWEIIVWPYLSNTSAWFLLDKDYSDMYGTLRWYDRTELEIKSEIGANDDNMWKGYARWSAGCTDWRGICAGGVTGGTELS